MIRRIFAATLAAVLFAVCFSFACAAETAGETALYTAHINGSASLYGGRGTDRIMYLKENALLLIYAVDPEFVYAEINGQRGYVYRSRIDQVEPIDPVSTPPYGVEVFRYTAHTLTDAPVREAPDENSKALITLHAGARFALIGAEGGWAKVIYHRQWGYVDTRLLSSLERVKGAADEEALDAPIAAYTSYYKIITTEANIGRMKNIDTACLKLSAITLKPGESLDFNSDIGPYTAANGYHKAPVLVSGETSLNYGGGTCQVSSTLYNVVLQLPGLTVVKRRAHGPSGASYLPHGVDAAVGNKNLNFIFRNDYDFPIRIDASAQDGALYIAIWRAEINE